MRWINHKDLTPPISFEIPPRFSPKKRNEGLKFRTRRRTKTLDEESLEHGCQTFVSPLSFFSLVPCAQERNRPLNRLSDPTSTASMKINGRSHATEAKVVAAVIGPDDSLKFLRAYASPTMVTLANRSHLIRYPVWAQLFPETSRAGPWILHHREKNSRR